MFRPELNVRYRPRLGTGIVAHNNGSAERGSVQIRGPSEGFQQWQHPKGLKLERGVPETTTRAREALLVVVAPEDLRRQQSGAMHMAVPSLTPSNTKQSMSNHTSGARARNSAEGTESSADSGGSSESSTMSDGDSVNVNNSQPLLRMTSGASMTTEKETVAKETEAKVRHRSGSMLEENEGENEVDEDVNIIPESPARYSDVETHSIQREPESAATTWTDDKHSSFLNSMEATFVRSLYSQQGLGHLGVHGNPAHIDDSEQDCVESRPVDTYGCCTSHPTELFEFVQGGQQHQKPSRKPQGLDSSPATTTKAVLSNPWVRHFKQRISNSEYESNHLSTFVPAVIATSVKEVGSAIDLSQVNPHSIERDQYLVGTTATENVVEENQHCGASEDIDNKETQNCAAVAETDHQGFRLWQNRLQAGGQTLVNSSSRKDTASWVPKRPSTFDTENADAFMNKRIKTTQQELAQKDLEMLEQYVAKQRAGVPAAGEHSEQAILEYARKAVETSVEEAGPSSASDQKETRKVGGRSAMDQVVPLLGRMDSYESRSSLSFPDLNTPSHLPTGAACAVITETGSEGRGRRTLYSSVPDLNAPLRIFVPSSYTTNQPTINFTKDGEAVAKPWSPRPEMVSMEERYFHELAGATYQPSVQGCQEDDGRNLSLELQTKGAAAAAVNEAFECEPQLSPISNSRTWTWGLRGFRRRLHDPSGVVPATQPSRSLRDGIHFSDHPVPFRSSGQHV